MSSGTEVCDTGRFHLMASRPLESAQVRRGAAFSLVNSIGSIFLEKFAKFLQVVGHDVRVVASATAENRSLPPSTIPKASSQFKRRTLALRHFWRMWLNMTW